MPTKRPREEDDQSNHDEEEVDQVVESDAEEPTAAPSREAGEFLEFDGDPRRDRAATGPFSLTAHPPF